MDDFSSLTKQLNKRRNLLGKGATSYSSNIHSESPKSQSLYCHKDSHIEFRGEINALESASKCPSLDLRFREYLGQGVNGGSEHRLSTVTPSTASTGADETNTPIPIYSAGTVRSRYRDLKKKEENRVSRKHAATLKKHTVALRREAGVSVPVGASLPEGEEEDAQEEHAEAFCAYPADTVIVDNLQYSKYCTDAVFKNELLIRVKRELQQGGCVLLRSQWLADSFEAERKRASGPEAVRIAGQVVQYSSAEDVYREAKQVLKSVFMACMGFSGHAFPPPIEEATVKGKLAYLEMLIYSRTHPQRPP